MIWVIIFLIVMNGYFVAAEFALVRLHAASSHRFEAGDGFRARIVRRMLNHMDLYLSTAQLGITFTSIALGAVGEPYVSSYLTQWFSGMLPDELVRPGVIIFLSLSLITMIQIIVGEQGPKSYGIRSYERVMGFTAIPMQLMYWVFFIPIQAVNFGSMLLVRALGGDASLHRNILSEEELGMLLLRGHSSGSISERERKIMANAMRLEESEAREVMVPRPDVIAIPASANVGEARELVTRSGHSRIPIIDPDLDHCIGFLYAKDLLRGDVENETPVTALAREAIYVPETINAEKLLYLFQTRGLHIAIAVDEFGGASGIVSLEDILEELVGEIHDEYDDMQPELIRRLTTDTWRASGMANIEDVEQSLDIEFDTDQDTLSGWFTDEKNDFAKRGDALEYGGYRFVVESTEHLRIASVYVERAEEDDEVSDEA